MNQNWSKDFLLGPTEQKEQQCHKKGDKNSPVNNDEKGFFSPYGAYTVKHFYLFMFLFLQV